MTFRPHVTVRGRLGVIRDRVLDDVRQQLGAGKARASVAVSESDVGRSLGVAVSMLCSEIELAGFRVLYASNPGWTHRSNIVVCAA